ncbi:MAG: protein phosphatase 2C domain-containing protein, partial [Actinomycetota bacterium]|nr:protein phosphatase 2C domain-containing protein [Actinomycetota bacterium]
DQYQQKNAEESIPSALNRALVAANKVVYEQARQWRLVDKMGSTLVAAVIQENVLHWISAGDSRAYLVSEQTGLQQLTTDHSYQHVLQLKVQKGEITQQEAQTSPMRSALTSFVGGKKIERIDQSGLQGIALTPGNWVLLCSDGLTGTLSDREILDAFRGRGPQAISKHLVDQVLQRRLPNQDNVSVLIMRIPVPGEPQEVSGLDTRAHYHIKSSPFQAITQWFAATDKGSDTVNIASRNKASLIVAVCMLLSMLIGFWLVLQPKPDPVPAPPMEGAPVVNVPVVAEPEPSIETPPLQTITLPSLEQQRAEVDKQKLAEKEKEKLRLAAEKEKEIQKHKKAAEREKPGVTSPGNVEDPLSDLRL